MKHVGAQIDQIVALLEEAECDAENGDREQAKRTLYSAAQALRDLLASLESDR